MAKNLEELRKENPELASQVEADIRASLVSENDQTRENAVAAERQRLAEIDEIAALYDDETVRNAKYGDNACNASELALRAAKEAAKTGNAFMAGALRDAQASGANNVTSAPAPEDVPESTPKTGEEKMAKARADVNALLSKNN